MNEMAGITDRLDENNQEQEKTPSEENSDLDRKVAEYIAGYNHAKYIMKDPIKEVTEKICNNCSARHTSCWYRDRKTANGGNLCRKCYTTEYLTRLERKKDGTLERRSCVSCNTTETSAWYRSQEHLGQFDCIKCYQRKKGKKKKEIAITKRSLADSAATSLLTLTTAVSEIASEYPLKVEKTHTTNTFEDTLNFDQETDSKNVNYNHNPSGL
jgi:hypothetical protein